MMKAFIVKNLKLVYFSLGLIITILLGILIGAVLVFQRGFSFPQIENLEDYEYKVMTVVHDDQGNPIKEFAIEKRTLVQRSDIPEILVKALIATEDNQFYSHWGVNFRGTFRAIFGILTGKNKGGGSSITQQLALNHNLKREKTFLKQLKRKLKEMLMAIQIERRYSKDQILTAYCNTVPLAGNICGVAEASRYYFGKPLKDINLAEAVLIPSMFAHPNRIYNVFKQPQNCLEKRNRVLKRMVKLKFITEEQYKEAIKFPLPKKPFKSGNREEIGAYFTEEIRRRVKSEFGANKLYTGGLKIYTTLNSEMQLWAEESLKEGLRALDKRRGWRGDLENVFKNDKEKEMDTFELPSWEELKIEKGKILKGVVLEVNDYRAAVKIGSYKGLLDASHAGWAKKKLQEILKRGDVASFKLLEIPEVLKFQPEITSDNKKNKIDINKYPLKLGLEQEPEVQGAMLVVDNKTGEIKAMVGGYSFEKSEWNIAIQALRQPGSTFKPIIYSAAIENGFTPADIMEDELTTFDNEWTNIPYTPENDSGDYVGPITLRRGFQQSRNVISAKIVEYLTPSLIVDYARNFGITSPLKPYMSIALGSFEVTLKEMVAAYTIFPNLGLRVDPFLIKKIVDQNNQVIKAGNYYNKKRVLEEESAYIINYLMQGIVKWGTGKRAGHLQLKAPIGGKTGTTNGWTNAWFIGFSPSITVGVWVGFDTPRSLGKDETGSRAANPIFINFMEKHLKKYPEPAEFKKPSGIILVKIDRYTGKLFSGDCIYPFEEAFIRGTEPHEYCREEDHEHILNYYEER